MNIANGNVSENRLHTRLLTSERFQPRKINVRADGFNQVRHGESVFPTGEFGKRGLGFTDVIRFDVIENIVLYSGMSPLPIGQNKLDALSGILAPCMGTEAEVHHQRMQEYQASFLKGFSSEQQVLIRQCLSAKAAEQEIPTSNEDSLRL